MNALSITTCRRYRIWIVAVRNWMPAAWTDVPPRCVAVEAADAGSLSADEAAHFLEGFNQTMLAQPRRLWAIPVPVEIRYDGDLAPGRVLTRDDVNYAAFLRDRSNECAE